jgi:hypothetical protein
VTDPELELLLDRLGRSGFLLHAFRTDRHGPQHLAAVLAYGRIADVVLFDGNTATAHRTPTGAGDDLFAPRHVYWIYGNNPIWTLRAVLTLPPPHHPGAPTQLIGTPPGYGIPATDRSSVRVRRRSR